MPTGSSQASSPPQNPRDVSQSNQPDDHHTKRDLASWWKQFKKTSKKEDEKAPVPPGIFGVPLQNSIRYANVAISLFDSEGRSFIYGYVPIVVAKCGVFLKERATETEGIFRLAGAERRMKELQVTFNSPDRYGKGLDWTGYTVHDAANILRRYLNQLPEPIIPLDFYQRFREPIRGHQSQAVGEEPHQEPSDGDFDADVAIKAYQQLITELPPLNRQLLLYILDLLAVFASKSDLNRMTAPNLSAIFQPAILRHPQHDMAPKEYRLNQDVIIFLIDNQDHFLVGMQGTAADEKTIQEVQSGAPAPSAPSPNNRNTPQALGRSSSNASAGAESVRRYGNLRRNVSLSSKRSGQSAHTPSPVTPPPDSPYSANAKGGVHRSNTVPSKRQPSPALAATTFQKEKPSDQGEANVGMATATIISPVPAGAPGQKKQSGRDHSANSRNASASSNPPAERMSPHLRPIKSEKQRNRSHDRQLKTDMPGSPQGGFSPTGTPSRERTFSSFFNKSPIGDVEKRDNRKPNKLQKRRPDNGALNAQASNQSLSGASYPPSPGYAAQTQDTKVLPIRNGRNGEGLRDPSGQTTDGYESAMEDLPPPAMPRREASQSNESQFSEVHQAAPSATQHPPLEDTAQAPKDLPDVSSSATPTPEKPVPDTTPALTAGEEMPDSREQAASQPTEAKEKKHFFHIPTLSRDQRSDRKPSSTGLSSSPDSPPVTDPSAHTAGGLSRPQKSMTGDSANSASQSGQPTASDSENGTNGAQKKGPIAWFRGKRQEKKEKDAEKERAKSPSKERPTSADDRQSSRVSESAGE